MTDDFMKALAQEAADAPESSPGSLDAVQKLGDRVVEIEAEMERLEARSNELKAEKNEILTRRMVDVMDGANVPDLTIGDLFFSVGPYYHAAIKEDEKDPESLERAEKAYDWLEASDAGDIIKRTIKVEFPKEFEEEARACFDQIVQNYQMASVSMKRGVPWATLTKFLREHFEAGNEPPAPLELLGATVGRVVKIKPAKEGGRKKRSRRR